MGIMIFILFFYFLYVVIFVGIIFLSVKIYERTHSFLFVFAFISSVIVIGFWKLLYGYSMYFIEIKTWPKQEVFKSVYNVKENIVCTLRKEYFLYENNSSNALKTFIELYRSNKNQLYSDHYHGIYCHYYDRNKKQYEFNDLDNKIIGKKKVDYLIINSTQEIGILTKTAKEIYDLKNNQLLGIEHKLAMKNIKYLPFLNFFPGTYWGYTNETQFPTNLENLVFKTKHQ